MTHTPTVNPNHHKAIARAPSPGVRVETGLPPLPIARVMPSVVRTGSRLHFGFLNLSLAHQRLYGGIGLAVTTPATVVHAEPAPTLDAPADLAPYAERAIHALDVPGATIHVESAPPRHAGLGSGTQLALATYTAIATAYDPTRTLDVRDAAPELDRGGRSGIGVAAFEHGGFILDAGHPVEQFTTRRPDPGEWTVPPRIAHHSIPADWRFVLVVPDTTVGPSGPPEEACIRAVIETADPGITDQISTVVTQHLLPGITTGDVETFGDAITTISRLNGVWYADEQGGIYRPPIGDLVADLANSPAISGAGQSSWGPTTFALTDTDRADTATQTAHDALDDTGHTGSIILAEPKNTGATTTHT